ncbi:MAG TPA: sugar phosphate nucleotidyltransferase [Salinimicrobium sp.]|nr:sugar phosphate nucleotidyltransferase [Salinimicrobium sp.]
MAGVFHVLLSGGVGSRLWPLSRRSKPKQYLEIFSDQSLFELAVKRNFGFSDGLIVVGNAENKDLSESIIKRLGIQIYRHILEATPRNTAPAIAFAAFSTEPDDILLVTPADHIIGEGEAYTVAVTKAISLAKTNNLVTFGIQPTKPETGYGYLETQGSKVISFREKPDERTAENFLKKGNFLWNSGMFCFKSHIFLEQLQEHSPEVYKKALEAWALAQNAVLQYTSSMSIPCISVDYAVMEKSSKIKVVRAEFEWNDMGSFEAVYDYLKEAKYTLDKDDNMQLGDKKPTFFVGLRNCIIISTKEVNLVLSKEASQDVKAVYQFLEKNNPELLL